MPPVLRSILAVIAGFVTLSFIVGVLTAIAISTLHLKSGHPTPGYLVINVAYSFLAAIAAGFVTALIAGRKPIEHAGVLAIIALAAGIVSYRHYTGTEPVWYRWVIIIAPPLLMIAGGYIVLRKERTLSH